MKEQIQKYKGVGISFFVGLATMLVFMHIFTGDSPSGKNHAEHVYVQNEAGVWTCSMHPQIKLPEPGLCPICNMDLIPLKRGTSDGSGNEATLTLSETARKLAKIQTVAVERKNIEAKIRIVGKVEYDETKLFSITSWMAGRIDRLFVDYTGILIQKGDHMVKIYSSELLSAQEEYLQALQSIKDISSTDLTVMKETSQNTLVNAREKLKLLGISEKQIDEIESRGTASDVMTIYAPIGGIVVSKNVTEGSYVKTGSVIYTIADLSKVWLKLDAYETDISSLRYGQKVIFDTESYPGEIFEGMISFIDPVMNDKTRTIKVRVNVDNSMGKLKPGMFVRATVLVTLNAEGVACDKSLDGKLICSMHPEILKDAPGKCDICGMPLKTAKELGYACGESSDVDAPLIIPVTAPLITGKRAVVYVERMEGSESVFEGREIILGARAGDFYIVKEGLNQGEMVVVNGNFKIDSALQIQAKPSMMSPKKEMVSGSNEKPIISDIPITFVQSLSPIYDAYFSMQKSLAADDFIKAKESLALINDSLAPVDMNLLKNHTHHKLWMEISEKIKAALLHRSHIQNISDIRNMILQNLSEAVIDLSETFGQESKDHFEMVCPMAKEGKGASWLQDNDEVSNPYYGEAMLRCGSVKQKITASERKHKRH